MLCQLVCLFSEAGGVFMLSGSALSDEHFEEQVLQVPHTWRQVVIDFICSVISISLRCMVT